MTVRYRGILLEANLGSKLVEKFLALGGCICYPVLHVDLWFWEVYNLLIQF
jgi:hypothetical protein